MQIIYFDGTDQYIMVRIGGIDNETGTQTILTGAINEDLLSGGILVWSEYKKEDVSIDTPSIMWNSFAGMWKVKIPFKNITQCGTAWVNISGTNIISLSVEVYVQFEIFDIATPLNAIKTITDQLTLSNINSQVDLALSDYDSPTKIELDNAILPLAKTSDITALNNLSTSQVLVQVQDALNSYDSPTKIELDNAILPLAKTSDITSLHNLSEIQVLSQINTALVTYDPPTKIELDNAISTLPTKVEMNAAFDLLPTVVEIINAFDSDIIDGNYTRKQVERIIAAVLLGIRINVNGQNKYTGIDGLTARLVTEQTPNFRSIVSRDGD